MKTYNFSKSEPLPDYINEHEVFGLVKSNRTSVINRFISTEPKKQGWHDLIAGSYVIKSEIKSKR